MSQGRSAAVVVDTMVMSAVVNATRRPNLASAYRSLIGGRPVLISFATVTELRYGAVKAGWGELRQRRVPSGNGLQSTLRIRGA